MKDRAARVPCLLGYELQEAKISGKQVQLQLAAFDQRDRSVAARIGDRNSRNLLFDEDTCIGDELADDGTDGGLPGAARDHRSVACHGGDGGVARRPHRRRTDEDAAALVGDRGGEGHGVADRRTAPCGKQRRAAIVPRNDDDGGVY